MSRRVTIVGAGVIGLSTAYYLARRGLQVTVVDRAGPEDEGCSFGNAGLVVPSHIVPLAAPGMVALGLRWMWSPESPFHVKPRFDRGLLSWGWKFYRASTAARVERAAPVLRDLHMAGRACFEELADATGNAFDLEKRGLLVLVKTERALEEEEHAAERARKLGMPAEVLDPRAAAALEPGIRMDIAGAVFFPLDCHLTPWLLMQTLRRRVEEAGVTLAWRTEVAGWRTAGARVEAMLTSRGDMVADEYVLAGGSWSPLLSRDLGLKLPMQAGKGYSLTLRQPRRLPRLPALLTEARVAVTPMSGALRFGGTMEIAGLDRGINPARVRGIMKSVPKYYPEITAEDFEGVRPWSGLRPCSPDGMPYVGRTKRLANLVIATGHAMLGISLGPITGKLVAEIIAGEKPSIDIGLLEPDRYG